MLGEGGARGRQRQWSQLWLRGGSSCLAAYQPPTISSSFTLLQLNLYCPFLRLLLQQLLSALPNSTAPRSTLRLLFLALPPAAGGNHPPSITSIEAANISSLRPKTRFPPQTVVGARLCHHLCRVRTEWISITFLLQKWGLCRCTSKCGTGFSKQTSR